MIQRIVKVKSTEFLPTKDGKKQYLSAVLTDGKKENKYSIFDPQLQSTIQDAEKAGAWLDIGLEKEGNFWNLKTAAVLLDYEEPPTPEVIDKPSRQPRSTDQNVSIEKQVKLKVAEGLYKHCAEVGTPLNEELFLNCYRISAQAFRNDGDLVSEIKNLGGVEK